MKKIHKIWTIIHNSFIYFISQNKRLVLNFQVMVVHIPQPKKKKNSLTLQASLSQLDQEHDPLSLGDKEEADE